MRRNLVRSPRCNTGTKTKARHCRAFLRISFSISSFRQLGDLMREPRDLWARIVLVNNVALRCLHEFRFGAHYCLQRCIAVSALDRLFDNADRAAHLGAARLVDNGAAGNLARRLLGGSRIGHVLKYPSGDRVAKWSSFSAPDVQPHDRRWCVVLCPLSMPDRGKHICLRDGAAQRTAAAGFRPPPLAPFMRG